MISTTHGSGKYVLIWQVLFIVIRLNLSWVEEGRKGRTFSNRVL